MQEQRRNRIAKMLRNCASHANRMYSWPDVFGVDALIRDGVLEIDIEYLLFNIGYYALCYCKRME